MQFYVHHDGQQMGPFSPDQLRSYLLAGTFQSTDLAWHEGSTGWAPLNSFPAIVGPTQPYQSLAGLPPPMPASQFPESSGLAIASLVLGILSFFTVGLTAIPAVICGHVSLSQIKQAAGRLSGNGYAIGGLATGYFGVICAVALLAGVAFPAIIDAQDRPQAAKCLFEAKQIGVACKLYAMDHHGSYPPALAQLVPDYLPNNHFLECPLRKNQPPMGYAYFGGHDTDPPARVLLSSKAATRDHKRIVITCDGVAVLQRDH